MEPVSDILYPVLEGAPDAFDLFEHKDDGTQSQTTDSKDKLVGLLSVSFYWRDVLKNILPTGSHAVVVFENPCSPTFTYAINGPTVEFLGTGDFHPSKYDHLEESSNLLDLRKFAIKDSTYSGIPVNQEYCPFHIRVFPSQLMEDKYATSDGIIFAVCAALIFVFTSFVFVLYDFWVSDSHQLISQGTFGRARV